MERDAFGAVSDSGLFEFVSSLGRGVTGLQDDDALDSALILAREIKVDVGILLP